MGGASISAACLPANGDYLQRSSSRRSWRSGDIAYGRLIMAIIFLIIAFVVFMLVRSVNS
jgi:large-conductance mechanosensitive channel